MTVHKHAVVWIDHRLAKLFYLGLDAVEQVMIEAHLTTEHLHHKANSIGSGNLEHDPSFFRRIEEALRNCEAALIVGPGTEKSLLLKYLKESPHAPEARIYRPALPTTPRNAKSLRSAGTTFISVNLRGGERAAFISPH